jgi:hypothetical protein
MLSQRYKAIGISAVQPDTVRPLIAKIESLLPSLVPAGGGDGDATGTRSPVLVSPS